MAKLESYVGQVLDDKYRLEQLLGQGGMGAVYLATHLGTERYVALKLIAPQFMRNREFVERFKREARAAGRLRHPNVVDVTDFGFAQVKDGQVAYLVMEYLDGCTLGDVLAEEKTLSLEWTVDILEQVCSAVHEAHQLGIVHRDLKPDNIWLEPNRLGSYRVKVLDFGIAKLADVGVTPMGDNSEAALSDPSSAPSIAAMATKEVEDELETTTLIRNNPAREINPAHKSSSASHSSFQTGQFLEADEEALTTEIPAAKAIGRHPARSTVAQASSQPEDNDGTLLFQSTQPGSSGTRHESTAQPGPALTRIGAIMGTPLYMSPEQCGGGSVDARTDIYSLGVIAYQMLAGETPFAGNTSAVMRAHLDEAPTSLRERAAKIPKRVAGVVMSSLAKEPAERPQTAFAFASALRGQAEGIGSLYRRAFSLYSEYFPKFLKLSLIAHLPVIVATILLSSLLVADRMLSSGGRFQKVAMISATAIAGLFQGVSYLVAAAVISGVTAVIVTQLSVAPLRPVELRSAFDVLKRRWKPFLKTMIRVTLRIVIGYILLVIPGLVISIRYALYAPVVLIEGLEKKAAMRRARELASRSWRTVIIISILQILIPMFVSLLVGRIRLGVGAKLPENNLSLQLSQQFLGLVNIFVIPLMSIVPALLYLKMRQLGGEPLSQAFAQIEQVDSDRSQWQQRMRTRLSLYTPQHQKTTSEPGGSGAKST
jgi:serine/threonine protein kinase